MRYKDSWNWNLIISLLFGLLNVLYLIKPSYALKTDPNGLNIEILGKPCVGGPFTMKFSCPLAKVSYIGLYNTTGDLINFQYTSAKTVMDGKDSLNMEINDIDIDMLLYHNSNDTYIIDQDSQDKKNKKKVEDIKIKDNCEKYVKFNIPFTMKSDSNIYARFIYNGTIISQSSNFKVNAECQKDEKLQELDDGIKSEALEIMNKIKTITSLPPELALYSLTRKENLKTESDPREEVEITVIKNVGYKTIDPQISISTTSGSFATNSPQQPNVNGESTNGFGIDSEYNIYQLPIKEDNDTIVLNERDSNSDSIGLDSYTPEYENNSTKIGVDEGLDIDKGFKLISTKVCIGEYFTFTLNGQKNRVDKISLKKDGDIISSISSDIDGNDFNQLVCKKSQCANTFSIMVPNTLNEGDSVSISADIRNAKDRNSKPFTVEKCEFSSLDKNRIIPKVNFNNDNFKMVSDDVCKNHWFTFNINKNKKDLKKVSLLRIDPAANKEERVVNSTYVMTNGYEFYAVNCTSQIQTNCSMQVNLFANDTSLSGTFRIRAELSKGAIESERFIIKECDSEPKNTVKQLPPRYILNNAFQLVTNYICKSQWFTFSVKAQRSKIERLRLYDDHTKKAVSETQTNVAGDFLESVPCQVKDECRNYFNFYLPNSLDVSHDYYIKMDLKYAKDRSSSSFNVMDCRNLTINGTLLQQPPVPGPRLGGIYTFLSNKACQNGWISVRVRASKSNVKYLSALFKRIFGTIALSIALAFFPGIGVVGSLASVQATLATIVSTTSLALEAGSLAFDAATTAESFGKINSVKLKRGSTTIFETELDHYGNKTSDCSVMNSEGCNLIADLYIDPSKARIGGGFYVETDFETIGVIKSNEFAIENCGNDYQKYYFRYPQIYDDLRKKEEMLSQYQNAVVSVSSLAISAPVADVYNALNKIRIGKATPYQQQILTGLFLSYGLTFDSIITRRSMHSGIYGNCTTYDQFVLYEYYKDNIATLRKSMLLNINSMNVSIPNSMDTIHVNSHLLNMTAVKIMAEKLEHQSDPNRNLLRDEL